MRNIDRDSQLYSEHVWKLIEENTHYFIEELTSKDAVEEIRRRSVENFDNVIYILQGGPFLG